MRSVMPLLLCLAVASGCRTTPKLWAVPERAEATLRQTTSGQVVGGPAHFGAHAWLGIPFAAPPVGELRWRAPQPPAPWAGTREALVYGPACPQRPTGIGGDSGGVRGEEDCLTLNVFAPAFGADHLPRGPARLPVMLWIHGGGNSIGTAAMYDGAHLATSQQVLVVTTQYRLGPLGWFDHDALEQPSGNFGTLDLVRALEWVRDNAEAFGGDPGNVTIFGESAGGFDVYSLLLAPQAKGLFHRAIVQSGMLIHYSRAQAQGWADDAQPGHRNSSNEVAANLLIGDGKATDRQAAKSLLAAMSHAELAAYLRGKSATQILDAYGEGRSLGMLDAPLLIGDGVVLPKGDWLDALAQPTGWNRVPVMVGTNKEELKLFMFLDRSRVTWWFGVLPRVKDATTYEVAAEAGSRFWKANGVDLPAAAMVRSGHAEVFAYRFDWRGQKKMMGTDLGKLVGAAHSVEIGFVFGDFGGPLGRLMETDDPKARDALSDQMMSYWGRFAREGAPGRGSGQLPEWTAWSEASPEAAKYLVLDVPNGGGLRMANQTETVGRIVAELKTDPRLPTVKARCSMLREFAALSRVRPQAVYEEAAGELCATWPWADWPWNDRKP